MRGEIMAAPLRPATTVGAVLLAFSLLLYAFGRSQSILIFEVGSQIPLLASLLLSLISPSLASMRSEGRHLGGSSLNG